MTQITLPKTSQTGTNEWADVEDNDVAIRDVVNGNLDNGNVAAGAAVSYSKLASMSTGAVLLGNAGTPTATALSGDATVGATGVVTTNPLAKGTRVTNSGTQSITTSTLTAVTWDTEVLDTDTMHSTSSNTSRLTATTAGVYVFTAQIAWDSNTTGYRVVTIFLLGVTGLAGTSVTTPLTSVTTPQSVTTPPIALDATNYVEVMVYHTKGSSLNLAAVDTSTGSSVESSFGGVRIGRAS